MNMEVKENSVYSNETFCNGFVDKCFQYINPIDCIQCGKIECECVNTVHVEKILSSSEDEHEDNLYVDPLTGELKDLECCGSIHGFITEKESNQSSFFDEPQTDIDREIVDDEILKIKSETSKFCTVADVLKKLVLIAFHLVYKVRVCQLSDSEFFYGNGKAVRLLPKEIHNFKCDILIASNKHLKDLANNFHRLNADRQDGDETLAKANLLILNAIFLFKLQNALFGLRPDSELIPKFSNKNYTWLKEEVKLDKHVGIAQELLECIASQYVSTTIKIQNRVSEIVKFEKTRKQCMDLTAYSTVMMKESMWQSSINKNEQEISVTVLDKSPQIQKTRSLKHINEEKEEANCFAQAKSLSDKSLVKLRKRDLCDKTGILVTTKKALIEKQRISNDVSPCSKSKQSKDVGSSQSTKQPQTFVTTSPRTKQLILAAPICNEKSVEKAEVNKANGTAENPILIQQDVIMHDTENGFSSKEKTINLAAPICNEKSVEKAEVNKANGTAENPILIQQDVIMHDTENGFSPKEKTINLAAPICNEKSVEKAEVNKANGTAENPILIQQDVIMHGTENGFSAKENTMIDNLVPCPKELNYPLIIQSIKTNYEEIISEMRSRTFDMKEWIKELVPAREIDLVTDNNLDIYFRKVKKSQLMQRILDITSCKTDFPSRPALAITKVTHILDTPADLTKDLLRESGASGKSLEYLIDELAKEFQTLNRLSGCINCPPNSYSPQIPITKDYVDQIAEKTKKHILPFDSIQGNADENSGQTLPFQKIGGIYHIPISGSTFASFAFLIPNQLGCTGGNLPDNQPASPAYQLVKLQEVLQSTLKQHPEKIRTNLSVNLIVTLPKGTLFLNDLNSFINSGSTKPPSVQPIENFSFSADEAVSYMPQSFQLYNSEMVCCDIVRNLLAIVSKLRNQSCVSNAIQDNEENEQFLPRIEKVFSLQEGVARDQSYSISEDNCTPGDGTRDLIDQRTIGITVGISNHNREQLDGGTEITAEVSEANENDQAKNQNRKETEEILPSSTISDKTEHVDLATLLINRAVEALKSISPRLNVVLNKNAVYFLKSFCNQIVSDGIISKSDVHEIQVLLEILDQGKYAETSESDDIIIPSFREYDGVQTKVHYQIIQSRDFPPQGFKYIKTKGIFYIFGYIPYPFELCTLLNATNAQTKWLCSLCLKAFSDIDSYIAHEDHIHSTWFAYVCSKCNSCLTSHHQCRRHLCDNILVSNDPNKSGEVEDDSKARGMTNTKIKETHELCDSCVFVLENLDKLISHIMTKTRSIIFKCDECFSCTPQRQSFNRHKSVHKIINKRKLVLKKCVICYQLYDLDVTDNQVQHTSPSTVGELKTILYALFDNMEGQTKASKDRKKSGRSVVTEQEIKEWKSYLSYTTDLPYTTGIYEFNSVVDHHCTIEVEPVSNAITKRAETSTSNIQGKAESESKLKKSDFQRKKRRKKKPSSKRVDSQTQGTSKPTPQIMCKSGVTLVLPIICDVNTSDEKSDTQILPVGMINGINNSDILVTLNHSTESNACELDGTIQVEIEPTVIDDSNSGNPVKYEPMEDIVVQTEDIVVQTEDIVPPKVIDKPFAEKHLTELLLKCDTESEMKMIVGEALQWKLNDSNLFTEQEITQIVREVFQILKLRNVKEME